MNRYIESFDTIDYNLIQLLKSANLDDIKLIQNISPLAYELIKKTNNIELINMKNTILDSKILVDNKNINLSYVDTKELFDMLSDKCKMHFVLTSNIYYKYFRITKVGTNISPVLWRTNIYINSLNTVSENVDDFKNLVNLYPFHYPFVNINYFP